MCRSFDRKYEGLNGLVSLDRRDERSVDDWKREVNKHVQDKGWQEWRQGMEEKCLLGWYRVKKRSGREWFNDGSFGSDLLFKARTKSLELNSTTYRWMNEENTVCDEGVDDTVDHLFQNCSSYDRQRREMLEEVVREIGTGEWEGMKAEGRDRVMETQLGLRPGRNSTIVVGSVKRFLERVWRKRKDRTE